ncbi:MAG: hypothetical protein ACREVE_08675 [Gammaproteobacteria bacterium]
MRADWLVAAFKAVSWKEIGDFVIPRVIEGVRRKGGRLMADGPDIPDQPSPEALRAVEARIERVEQLCSANAEAMEQLAQQLELVSKAIATLHGRLRLVIIVGSAAAVVLFALLFAFFS